MRASRLANVGLLAVISLSCTLAADPFPAEIDLRSLDPANGGNGSTGTILKVLDRYEEFGDAVTALGDINADGIGDLMIGGPVASFGCPNCSGFTLFGHRGAFPPVIDMVQLTLASGGSEAFIARSLFQDSGGSAIGGIGDLNSDGIDDFIVGAFALTVGDGFYAGAAYVMFGRDTGYPSLLDAEDLLPENGGDGSQGFELEGYNDDRVGYSVAGGCDLNADGIPDVAIGAPTEFDDDTFEHGAAYVIYGRATSFPARINVSAFNGGGDSSLGFLMINDTNANSQDFLGGQLSCAGDVNGDGIRDLLVSAAYEDDRGLRDSGAVYVLYGSHAGFETRLDPAALRPEYGGDGSRGFVIPGTSETENLGVGAAIVGDVNGDGVDDFALATYTAERVYVIFGRGGGFPASFDVTRLLPENGGDGREGVVLYSAFAGDLNTASVAGAGDVNGDGVVDLVIGAQYGDAPGRTDSGIVYVLFGRRSGFPAEIDLLTLQSGHGGDGSAGFALLGVESGDRLGVDPKSVGTAGDVNGDGIDDLLAGAALSQHVFEYQGEAYLIFGRPTDPDGDGVTLARDNCAQIANTDQRDTDGDGIGNACDADLNNDCIVNFSDLGMLKAVFFTSDPNADFNGDGNVNFIDLGIMQQGFFRPPGPSGLSNACD